MNKINFKKLTISILTILSLFAPVSTTVMATENLNREFNQQKKTPEKKIERQKSNKTLSNINSKSNINSNDVVNMSNFYAGTNASSAPKGGIILIKVFAFSTTDHTMMLPRFYIVLPKGTIAVDGLKGVQKAFNDYVKVRNIHGDLDVKQLANTDVGREVYQVTPIKGTYVDKQEGSLASADIPVRITQTDHDLQKIFIDANQMNQVADDVLYAGAGDGENIQFDGALYAYPISSANAVGIKGGQDEFVRSIVLNGNRVEVPLYSPQVRDTYNIVDASNRNKLLKTITKQGEISASYNRNELFNSLKKLELDELVYAQDSMRIDSGELDGLSIFTVPNEVITTDKNRIYAGHTYTVSIKQYAAPITIKYLDENGHSIGKDQIINGFVGDKYDISDSKYKKKIVGYQLLNNSKNVTGVFSKEPITVIYQYKKNITNDVLILENKIENNKYKKTIMNPKKLFKEIFLISKKYPQRKISFANEESAKKKHKNKCYTVVVKYVDMSGKEIAKNSTITGKKGLEYSTHAKQIKGYTLRSQSLNLNGFFGETNFYFDKISGLGLRKKIS